MDGKAQADARAHVIAPNERTSKSAAFPAPSSVEGNAGESVREVSYRIASHLIHAQIDEAVDCGEAQDW
jgi:hypothetical protein